MFERKIKSEIQIVQRRKGLREQVPIKIKESHLVAYEVKFKVKMVFGITCVGTSLADD